MGLGETQSKKKLNRLFEVQLNRKTEAMASVFLFVAFFFLLPKQTKPTFLRNCSSPPIGCIN
jgi:hypothetical protein